VLEKVRAGIAKLPAESAGAGAEERNAALIARLIGTDVPAGIDLEDEDDPQRIREALFSATRVLIEGMAERHPLVLAFEDIHWADEGTLDLIEYLARWVRAPALIVCLARDDLLERRPGWGGGRRNATSLSLEPLSVEETRELLSAMPGLTLVDPYPTALSSAGRDDVFVGRVRRDPTHERGLCMFVVSDNLLKGAATNAVQIAEVLHERNLVKRVSTISN
jgi:hypothetical protein